MMSTDEIDAYPFFLNKQLTVNVNGREVATRFTASEWMEHWRPLLARIGEAHREHPKRLLVGIGGPPGTGKSVLAEQLNWVIGKGFLRGCQSVALPMDGFHFGEEYLRTHVRRLANGVEIPLKNVKGAPDTFDVEGLKAHIQRLRTDTEHQLTWPGYSRVSHDVVPNFYHVSSVHNVVIVEGNYVLLNRGAYTGLAPMFDLRIFVESPPVAIVSALLERHIAGGKPAAVAKEWVKRIDLPNARIAEASKGEAHVVVERTAENDIAALHWKGEKESDVA